MTLTRRSILTAAVGAAGGALTIAFSLPAWPADADAAARKLAMLDAWLAIDAQGNVTVYCGKAELGTGIQTSLAQLVAEELDVAFDRVRMIMADTGLCQDQLPTYGSLSLFRAGPELRRAAAQARLALLELASQSLGTDIEQLTTRDGKVLSAHGAAMGYGQLIGGRKLDRTVSKDVPLKQPASFRLIGLSQRRVDVPSKVFGTHAYIHNLRLPGLLHGRVCRSALPEATLESVDASALRGLPGHPRVLRKGNFVGVVADGEDHAVRAAAALKIQWRNGRALIESTAVEQALLQGRYTDSVVNDDTRPDAAAMAVATWTERRYTSAFQMHASIGPSCALADVRADAATLWSSTQSSFLTRDSVATLLGLPADNVRLIWTEGSGCYGQNGSDDCTADAALMSQLAGKPVRVQWMRIDEHRHEPKGPAMTMRVKAALSAQGEVAAWEYEVWSPTHSGRPFSSAAGNLLAGAELGLSSKYQVVGGDYNAKASYVFPKAKATLHLVERSELRASSLRALGAVYNIFAIESMMDELAAQSAQDAIAFRLRHLQDPRARAVFDAVAKTSRWQARPSAQGARGGAGRGVGFVHYNNYGAYVAAVVELTVDAESFAVTVSRVSVAHDCGLIVNPDGLRNQIEGNVIQALSRALLEEVDFGPDGVRSLDWASYPILRFSQVPSEIAIELIDRPDKPSLGAGEQTTCAVFAAVANALFDATGRRVRSAPFSPARLKAASGTGTPVAATTS